MAAYPIWQHTAYEAPSSASPMDYIISMEGTPVFRGKAWAKPVSSISTAAQPISITLNTICENYLSSDLPDLRGVTGTTAYTHTDAVHTFTIAEADTMKTLGTYTFVLDWSYTYSNYTAGTVRMSHPVNGRWTEGMYCFSTVYSSSAVTTTIARQPLEGYMAYDACHGDYALYYLNRYGGWDAFLVEGTVTRTDTYTKYSITSPYDNTTLDFGRRTYNNSIQPSWSLQTGLLKDGEAEALAFNLLSSNKVYMHSLQDGVIIPVVIADGSAEYRTFRNQGRSFPVMTITVEASQTEENLG